MKIVIATPLYPPEIGGGARYVKELAARLAAHHSIHVVTYAELPEHIPGVTVTSLSKMMPRILRVARFTTTLIIAARTADVLIVQNGSAAELPGLIAHLSTRTPLLFEYSDINEYRKKNRNMVRHLLDRTMQRYARHIFTDIPLKRPEILPLEPYPQIALEQYEHTWKQHIARIENFLNI